mmetsp:Transcript_17617/g.52925  ORF Transcript_17617/g.52925 Transcript_17617/m.52925 type:complete len:110 (+) Transcript_17617:426-755(+)
MNSHPGSNFIGSLSPSYGVAEMPWHHLQAACKVQRRGGTMKLPSTSVSHIMTGSDVGRSDMSGSACTSLSTALYRSSALHQKALAKTAASVLNQSVMPHRDPGLFSMPL